MTAGFGRSDRRILNAHEGLATLQWLAIIVPPSLGMWVFGAALIGLSPSSLGRVLAGAFLATGLATLLQLAFGWRVSVFEGPASIHLATLVIVAASQGGSASPGVVMGGLLVAGAVVLLLGITGADRLLGRIFSPAATAAFVLALVIILLPEAGSQAVNRSIGPPVGTGDAWLVLLVALGAGSVAYLRRKLRPFALLVALVAAVGAQLLMGWPASGGLDPGWTIPTPFVWGIPRFSLAASLPFALAGLAAALNVVGSVSAMSSVDRASAPGRYRQGLLVNGLVQGVHSAFVGFIGTVGHLESASVVRMLGRDGRRSLAMAAAGLVMLSFVDPAIRVMATIPAHISGTLLLLLVLVLGVVGTEIALSCSAQVRWLVIGPALVPPLWWVVSPPSGQGITAFLNPMVLAIVVAVAAERLLRSFLKAPAETVSASDDGAKGVVTERVDGVHAGAAGAEERVMP